MLGRDVHGSILSIACRGYDPVDRQREVDSVSTSRITRHRRATRSCTTVRCGHDDCPRDRRSATAAAVRRRAREAEIIAATRALFDERGVRDAQIEDIATAVGINRAIVYRHFTGKEELFALTLVGYLDELRESRCVEAADSSIRPGPAARRAGRRVRRLRRRAPGVRRLRPDPDATYAAPSCSTRSPRARCSGSAAPSRPAWRS